MLVWSSIPENERTRRLRQIKCWLLDMDGTVTLGEELLPEAERFFRALPPGSRYLFLTNNPSHSAEHYVRRMNRAGIPTARENVLTSTDAMILYLKDRFQKAPAVYSVGTPEFEAELAAAGFILTKERERAIDAVVLAFDTTLTYEKCDVACDYIRRGIPYFATNPDTVCPAPGGRMMPDCGALIAFVKTATGTAPEKVIGKPDSTMALMAQAAYGCGAEETAMAGDRIYTDLAFAKNAGILSVAVLSGEATLPEIRESGIEPDFIFDCLGDAADILLLQTDRPFSGLSDCRRGL